VSQNQALRRWTWDWCDSLAWCAIPVRSPRRKHPRLSSTVKRDTSKPSPSRLGDRLGDSYPQGDCLDGLCLLMPSSMERREPPAIAWSWWAIPQSTSKNPTSLYLEIKMTCIAFSTLRDGYSLLFLPLQNGSEKCLEMSENNILGPLKKR